MNKAPCISLIVTGFIIGTPGVIDLIILGNNYHHMYFWPTLRLICMILGMPMLFGGIIGFLTRNNGYSGGSSTELDLGRIRHTVETDSRRKQ